MKFLLIVCLILFSITIKAQHIVPKLGYSYSALEPYIDSVTMRIHYSKHHQAYVTNLNKALGSDQTKTLEELFKSISTSSPAVRNNGGGHYNHTLFWELLSPNPLKTPSIELVNQINKQFGSQDSLQRLINANATSLFGSGWVWLIVTPSKELKVTTTSNQDNPLMDVVKENGIPILAIDVWEHAYYLKHQNKRADYLKNIWNVIDWKVVSEKYINAIK